MQQEILKTFDDYSKSAINASKELIEINSRILNKVLETQIGLANLCVASGEKQLQASTAGSTDPKSFVTAQSALAEEFSAKLAEIAQNNAKFAQEATEELKAWFENGMKKADQVVKAAAKNASKASI